MLDALSIQPQVRLVGLNHRTAPVSVRERLAVSPESLGEVLARFRSTFPGCEAVILSTCNRVEIYIGANTAALPDRASILRSLGDAAGSIDQHCYEMDGIAAVEHLFNVSASLDSLIAGETQILGQVRTAFFKSVECNAAGPALQPVFQKAIAAGKRALSSLSKGAARSGVAGACVELAGQFHSLSSSTVLIIGAGEMAGLAMERFVKAGAKQAILASRDPQKAARLIGQLPVESILLADLAGELHRADIVIAATRKPGEVLAASDVSAAMSRRGGKPMLLIDLAVPRNISPAAAEITGVTLLNIDDLQSSEATTDQLQQAADIVAEQVQRFVRWSRARADRSIHCFKPLQLGVKPMARFQPAQAS